MGTKRISQATGGLLILLAQVGMLLAAAPTVAATASDLLQKAIYEEETIGNLDEAMKLYEQVIAEGEAGQEAGAQAQYRLALCYEKKGQDAEAQAAFKAVVTNFPNQKELVAQAQEHLSTELELLPAPWTPGERMQLNMTLPSGLPIGTMIYMVDASPVDGVDDAKHDGKEVTRCSTRGLVTVSDSSRFSEVFCDTESFTPIESFWKQPPLGEAKAVYGDKSVTITMVGNDKTFTIDFTPPVFDNEQCVELMRRLPLADDYKSSLHVITSVGGSEVQIPLSVAGTESVTVPAGTFECYKLELGIVNQTFWISTDEHRYVARFTAGGVSADLVKVWQTEPGQGERVDGKGFALSLPVGWLVYDTSSPEKSNETSLQLLDPRAVAKCEVAVRPKSSLQGDSASSTKAWTESFIDDVKKMYSDFAVSSAGLVETKVDGHPATQIVADFTDDSKKMRTLGVAVIGDQSAATLRFTTEASKFDSERGAFEEIVNRFELK
jgi:hypothetical protein